MQKGPSPEGAGLLSRENQAGTRSLHAEGGAAAAGRLHLGVVELEAGRFQRFDVVHRTAVQVHQRSGIYKYLQVLEAEDLVHHAALVFESHRVLEAGAAAADDADAQSGGKRILGSHDLAHLGDGLGRQDEGGFLFGFLCGCCGSVAMVSPGWWIACRSL